MPIPIAGQKNGADKPTGSPSPVKKKRHRSPAYPALSLEQALNRAKAIWEKERKNAAPLSTVVGHWGYNAKSSSGLLAAAALKKFGLLVDVEAGNERYVRLSHDAVKIVTDEQENSAERVALLKDMALRPPIHKELWERWHDELPSVPTMRTYLIRDRDFADDAADQLIEEYRQTISFAGLTNGDIIVSDPSKCAGKDGRDVPNPGDFIQWESQGMAQFQTPRKVLGVTEDGMYVFVEGAATGLPVEQVSIVNPPDKAAGNDNKSKGPPPPNPFAGSHGEQSRFTMTLPGEGDVVLYAPERLSEDSLELIQAWLKRCWKQLTRPESGCGD